MRQSGLREYMKAQRRQKCPPAINTRWSTSNRQVYSNVGTQGRRLDESAPIPETGFTIIQHQLTVYEAGNSVPYTGKLVALAKHQVAAIIDKTLH